MWNKGIPRCWRQCDICVIYKWLILNYSLRTLVIIVLYTIIRLWNQWNINSAIYKYFKVQNLIHEADYLNKKYSCIKCRLRGNKTLQCVPPPLFLVLWFYLLFSFFLFWQFQFSKIISESDGIKIIQWF